MKTAVVTGANRGIGLELTRQLTAKGTTVYATARKPAEASELQALAAGGNVIVSQLDAASPQSVQQWAQDLKSKVQHVDLLINNAGVGEWTGLASTTSEEMMRLFQTNTVGPLLVTQALHKIGLLGKPGGKSTVALMTSKMGSVEDNSSGGCYSYRASKAALNIVGKSLAIDLQLDEITTVLLHPGFVRTDMTGQQGLIDASQCVAGLLGVLESGKELNGHWYDFQGKEIPW